MIRKVVSLLFFILVVGIPVEAYGDEDYCPFELENHIFNAVECSDGNCQLDINLPKAHELKLSSVELIFGTEENYIRSGLKFEELEKSYSSVVYFSTEHSPFRIEAIYHKQACFSLLVLKIENRLVIGVTNEI